MAYAIIIILAMFELVLSKVDRWIDICNKTSVLTGVNLRRRPHNNHFPRIYEGFLFNDEVEMLEIHLNELSSVVDFFIIVESSRTFTNHSKRLVFNEIRSKFSRLEDKIIHIVVHDIPHGNPWIVEAFLRRQVFEKGLHGEHEAQAGDIIMISDVDEIVRPYHLQALKLCYGYDGSNIEFRTDTYYFSYSNRHKIKNYWDRPNAMIYKDDLPRVDAEDLRRNKRRRSLVFLNGGWHCSWCFPTLRQFVSKATSYSEEDHADSRFFERSRVISYVRSGRDLFDRKDQIYIYVEPNDIPTYVRDNLDRYGFLLDRRGPTAGFSDFFS
jgi:beta-1,4-mannosyl-glycoprotein beta-1,4-N-acetylglucosaminyltransferase